MLSFLASLIVMVQVEKLNVPSLASIADVAAAFDKQGVSFFDIACVNWPDAYPYRPQVQCRIAYSSQALYLQYKVSEDAVLATFQKDEDARSWEDSCVEFFLAPYGDDDPYYYNFECTCIGTCLMGGGEGRNDRERFGQEVTAAIRRRSSLGSETFGLREEPTEWTLTLMIPWKVMPDVKAPQPGDTMKANFYKCGDMMPVPHFVSWAPITTPSPDFHRPEFFGALRFL